MSQFDFNISSGTISGNLTSPLISIADIVLTVSGTNIFGQVSSDLTPITGNIFNLGSTGSRWNTLYVDSINFPVDPYVHVTGSEITGALTVDSGISVDDLNSRLSSNITVNNNLVISNTGISFLGNIVPSGTGSSSIGSLANPLNTVYALNVVSTGLDNRYVNVTGGNLNGTLTVTAVKTNSISSITPSNDLSIVANNLILDPNQNIYFDTNGITKMQVGLTSVYLSVDMLPTTNMVNLGSISSPYEAIYANNVFTASGSTANVVGPASSTPLAIAIFGDATGKLLQNTSVTINPNGTINTTTISGTNGYFINISGTNAIFDNLTINGNEFITNLGVNSVTGTVASFESLTGTNVSGTNAVFQNLIVLSPAFFASLGVGIVTGTTASFTNITGNNISGTSEIISTLNAFTSITTPLAAITTLNAENFTGTNISGTDITAQSLNGFGLIETPLITGNSAVFNSITGTFISGTTDITTFLVALSSVSTPFVNTSIITGTTASFTSITGTVANFTSLTGTAINATTITGTNIFQGSNQVINTVTGLGNISVVSNTNGFVTISGAATNPVLITGTAPILVTGTTVGIGVASASTNGYLTSTDWNRFNLGGTGSFVHITGDAMTGGLNGTSANFTTITGVNGLFTNLIQTNTINNNGTGNALSISSSGILNLATTSNLTSSSNGTTNLTSVGQFNISSLSNVGIISAGTINTIATGNYLVNSSGIVQIIAANGITIGGNATPLSSGNYNLGSTGSYFNNAYINNISSISISGTTIFENGIQVINSGIGLGNVTVSTSAGIMTISGIQYVLPTFIPSLGVGIITGNVASFNGITGTTIFEGSNQVLTTGIGLGTITTSVSNGVITISGSSTGVPNNVVISGTSTSLSVLNVPVLTGTVANFTNLTGTNINSTVFTSTVGNFTTLTGTTINATNITGTNIFQGSNQVINTVTGLGNISVVSNTNGFVTISGAATNPVLITGTAPILVTGSTIGIAQSTTSTNGFLSSTDWNTFNGKQAAGNYVVSGTSTILSVLNVPVLTGNVANITNLTGTNITSTILTSSVINATSITGTTIFENGVQVLTTGIGLGNVAVSVSNGIITITGTATSPVLITGTAPILVTGSTIGIGQSSASSNGYLTSTDWNTFNGKQAAGNYVVSGTSTSLTILNVPVLTGTVANFNSITGTTINATNITGTTLYGTTVFQGGVQVLTTGIGLGTVTTSVAGGVITISGSQYSLPTNVVLSGTSTILSVLNVPVLSGNVANITNLTGTLATFTTLNATNFTGTNISGTTAVVSTLNAFTSIVTPLLTATTINATNFTGTNISGTTATIQTINAENVLNLSGSSVITNTNNSGTGFLLFINKTGNSLNFNTLNAGTNVTITTGTNGLTINASGGGAGLVSSGTSLGSGLPIYAGLTGTILQFNSISGVGNTSISLVGGTLLVSGNTQNIMGLIPSSNEIPVGSINGSNKTFTLANIPSTFSLELFKDGALLNQSGIGANTIDYSLSGNSISMISAPLSGVSLVANYFYGSGVTINGNIGFGSSGISNIGSLSAPANNIYANNVYESGIQVVNSGIFQGTVTGNIAGGVITISGSAGGAGIFVHITGDTMTGNLTFASGNGVLFASSGSSNIGSISSPANVIYTNSLITAPHSEVWVVNTSGTGFGSTATTVRHFSGTTTNIGSDITYAQTAVSGSTFTINTDGVYSITYLDGGSSATDYGITLNATGSQLTNSPVNFTNLLYPPKIAYALPAANTNAQYFTLATTLGLHAGDVIRAQTQGNNGNTTNCFMRIVKLF